jgi:hypothetical protein
MRSKSIFLAAESAEADDRGRWIIRRACLTPGVIGAGFVAVLSLRYHDRLDALAPHGVVTGGFILFFAVLLLPVVFALGAPLFGRARHGTTEVNRVIR